MSRLLDNIFLVGFCIFLVGCSSFSSKNISSQKLASGMSMGDVPQHKILFVKENWHTSILLEAPPLLAAMPQLQSELEDQAYVRIGWGDGEFFSGKNKSNLSATRALFLSSYSAMQVLSYEEWPDTDEIADQSRVTLMISDQGLKNLIEFIRQSFAFNEDQTLKPLQSYDENTGSFFVARLHYSVINNCNSWSGKALEAAGISIGFHLTPSGVFSAAQKVAQQQLVKPSNR